MAADRQGSLAITSVSLVTCLASRASCLYTSCDLPLTTFQGLLDHIAALTPAPDYILWTGLRVQCDDVL